MVKTFKINSYIRPVLLKMFFFRIHYEYKKTLYDKIFEIWYFVCIYVEALNISFVNI